MKYWIRASALLIFGGSLTACVTTTLGPKTVLNIDGPQISSAQTESIVNQFINATSEAAQATDPNDIDSKSKAMLESGFAVIYANCDDFFASAGSTQKWITVSRDSVGALGTIATSALALHNGSKMAVSNVALATAAVFSGLDVYTKDFLFSAANIDSVRTLTMNALNTHRKAVEAIPGPVTYGAVVEALLDHQNICTPQWITPTVLAAIKAGNVQAAPDPSSEFTKVDQARDEKALRELGQLFGTPGAFSLELQARPMWQLVNNSPQPVDYKAIYTALTSSGIAASSLPIGSSGSVSTPWTAARREEVSKALNDFSDGTKASLNTAPAKGPVASPPVNSLHVTVHIVPISG